MAVYVVGLLFLWIVVSVPVYFAARVVKKGQAHFGEAMSATLGGVVVYYIVYFVVSLALEAVIGPPAGALALGLGVLAWLGAFKGSFQTSWWGAVGIVVLAWILLMALDLLLIVIFGVTFPHFYPF